MSLTQPWFAFRTAVSLHDSSHLGSSRSVNTLSLRDAGTGAMRSCAFHDHTFPSCLVAYPFTKMEYRVLYMLVLPDPWLTQEGPVTFLACALYQLFVRSCDLAHDGPHCSHFCAYTLRSLLLHLSLVFAFVSFCSHMEEHQNVQPSAGTTVESLLLYGQLTLCTTLSPTVT